jgi:hypothetical protein
MTVQAEPITVWQALSLLGIGRDGVPMSEERARRALREIGMKESEMDEIYPEEGVQELLHLIESPDCLDKAVEEANEWMVLRN